MSTEIKTITGRFENGGNPSTFEPNYEESKIHLTRFYGGTENGTMLQLTIQNSKDIAYVQLTKEQVKELVKTLDDSFDKSKYPSE